MLNEWTRDLMNSEFYNNSLCLVRTTKGKTVSCLQMFSFLNLIIHFNDKF